MTEAATLPPLNPREALASKERKDFNRKIEKIIKELPPEMPLRLVLGSSINDIKEHPRRDPSFYTERTTLHLSHDDVEFGELTKRDQFLWGNFNSHMSTWALLKKLKGRFSDIYFDWSTFRLFKTDHIMFLNELLQKGGHVYVPEPEFARLTSAEQRRHVLSTHSVKPEEEEVFWNDYIKEDSQKTLREAFESYGFSVTVIPNTQVLDPIFGQIRHNKSYREDDKLSHVLIATKTKDYGPSERP